MRAGRNWITSRAHACAWFLTVCAVAFCSVRVEAQPSLSALTEAQRFRAFTIYDLGGSYSRLLRSEILVGRAGSPRRMVWSSLYGACVGRRRESCTPPIEVQNYDACNRNLSGYQASPQYDSSSDPNFFGPRYSVTRIRGATLALFPDDPRVEVYTGRTTIVIFARSLREARASIGRLRPLNRHRPRLGELLPPAVRGAPEGQVRCA